MKINVFTILKLLQMSLIYEHKMRKAEVKNLDQKFYLRRTRVKFFKREASKAVRRSFTSEAKSKLELFYLANTNPRKAEIVKMARECNMPEEKVRAWFANKRYRERTQNKCIQ